MTKISIIGAGFVGSTAAYALLIRRVAREIALIDIHKEKAEGEAMDLEQGLEFIGNEKLSFGDSYELCKDSDIIVICAGLAQKPGETRLQLVQKNAEIFKKMIPEIAKNAPDSIIIIVSNPVDILTYLTVKYSGFPKERVFGTGTALDTARLRFFLSKYFGVSPKSVHAFIFGEHGDSEFPVWSHANIAGINIKEIEGYNKEEMNKIFEKTKKAAYEIIAKKGATYYAIGLVISDICKAIISDQKEVLPVSSLLENYYDVNDVCLSLPCVIGKGGIEKRFQLPLEEEEIASLRNSANILKDIIKNVK